MTVRAVTPLVPGDQFWSSYDRMVDDHCFPTCFDDGEDLQLTPATARAAFFEDVAGSDMTGATVRTRGDVAGTAPAPCAPSSLGNPALGVGATNVSGPGATHARPA